MFWKMQNIFISSLILLTGINYCASQNVVIIGAGISGLAAATNLVKNGFSVTVLEAQDYIGGRVKTQKFGNYDIELGAEWVHGWVNNSVFEIMEKYGVFIEEEDNSTIIGTSNTFATQVGEVLDYEFNINVQNLLNAIYDEKDDNESLLNKVKRKWAKNRANQTQSFGEFVTELFYLFNAETPIHERESIRNATLTWLELNVNIEDSADSWFNTSNSDEGEQWEYCEGNYETAWKPPSSYQSLIKVLLDQPHDSPSVIVPNYVIFNKEVYEIDYHATGNGNALVRTVDGSSYVADHVISTVSLGVLKNRHATLFKPQLSEIKQLAIEKIGFGTVNKIYLEFPNAWWFEMQSNFTGLFPLWEYNETYSSTTEWLSNLSDKELLADDDGLPVWTRGIESFKKIDSGSHPLALQAWLSGLPAKFIETQDLATIANGTLAVLRAFLGKNYPNIPDYTEALKSNWYSNSYFGGSYSFRTVDSEDFDVWAADLAEPVLNESGKPVLQFAGEATHDNYFSTVHGALDTGKREAQRLIDYYATKKQPNK